MVNSSLAYEILLYINSFYFGLFAICELGTMILKSVLIIEKYYDESHQFVDATLLGKDYGFLMGLFCIESIRLVLGRKGSLSERDIPVIVSVVLTLGSIALVGCLLFMQEVVLRIEWIWCCLMLGLLVVEVILACMFAVSVCRGPSYD